MSLGLRLFLVIGSLVAAISVLCRVRKSRMSMENSIFWVVFSIVLVLLGVFPDIAVWFAELLGVQSPVNLVYLMIIFLLLVRVFIQDQRLGRQEQQISQMAQHMAIDEENRTTGGLEGGNA